MTAPKLDAIDLKLLDALQCDASLSRKQLAERCSISEATCSRRLTSLDKRGFLSRHTVILDRKKLGLGLSVYTMVAVANEHAEDMKRFVDKLRKLPEVLTLSHISGDFDFLLHLVLKDMSAYEHFSDTYFSADPYVKKYQSLFEIRQHKYGTKLPLSTL